ncbi:MAG: hypothetical protein KAT05_13160, partial [Spirochaetes bacterium]|nr:hypothetical protein [Spirochaetota bacterium]
PAWGGHYRRRHEGRDYGRNGNNPHLRSPGYVRIRERVNGIDNDHMIFGIDILGLGFFMRVLHSDNNAAVALNFIFYPDEKIVKFPTKADRGSSGAHFHIEKWQNKKVRNKTIIYDPNNNQPVDVGTTFYFKYYNQIENSQNGVPRYNKDPNISVDEIHIQPNNPYQ